MLVSYSGPSWQNKGMSLFQTRKRCYCAFCRTERIVYTKRRMDVFNVLAAAAAATVVMLAIWGTMEPKAMLIFVAFLAIGETFVQIRWRLNIVCKECGFDPVLFLKDTEAAAQKVRLTLELRKSNPASLLKAPLKIPVLKKRPEAQQDLAAQQALKGRLLSRQL